MTTGPLGSERWRQRLIMMVKEPVMGRVKTRLARECGPVRATYCLRSNLDLTLRRVAHDPRWQTMLAVAPDGAIGSSMFPARLERVAQGGGDLGVRMACLMRRAPVGPVLIIGADIPGIGASEIATAFRALKTADAVFGPAGDGGYWLVGLAPRARALPVFENVRWSSAHALDDTCANLKGCRVAFTTTKDDIDSGADLVRLGAIAQRLIV